MQVKNITELYTYYEKEYYADVKNWQTRSAKARKYLLSTTCIELGDIIYARQFDGDSQEEEQKALKRLKEWKTDVKAVNVFAQRIAASLEKVLLAEKV